MNLTNQEKLELKNLKLKKGSHENISEGLCVMEAVAYFAKEPHSDRPQCACPILTRYMIGLNDSMNDQERQKLKPFIKNLIGTNDGKSSKRLKILVQASVCEITPYIFRLTKNKTLIKHADKLSKLKTNFTYRAAEDAADAATDAAHAAAYAADAATYAAHAAHAAAADAAHAAAYAAAYVGSYAAADAAHAAAYAADAVTYAAHAAHAAAAHAAAYAAVYDTRASATRQQIWKFALDALTMALKV